MKTKKSAATRQNIQPSKTGFLTKISEGLKNDTALFIAGLTVLIISAYLFISCISFLFNGGADSVLTGADAQEVMNSSGQLGARLSERLVNQGFGLPVFFMLFFFVALGCRLMKVVSIRIGRWFLSCAFLTVWTSLFMQTFLNGLFARSFIIPGGIHGKNVSYWLSSNIGIPGTALVLALTILLFCIYLTRRTIDVIRGGVNAIKRTGKSICTSNGEDQTEEKYDQTVPEYSVNERNAIPEEIKSRKLNLKAIGNAWRNAILEDDCSEQTEGEETEADAQSGNDEPEFTIRNSNTESTEDAFQEDGFGDEPEETDESSHEDGDGGEPEFTVNEVVTEDKFHGKIGTPYNPRLDLAQYKFPTANLMTHYQDQEKPTTDIEEQNKNKNRIIEVLKTFGIEIKSISATIGPTVTLYEITPAEGIRISKIRNLGDDIAMSLSAMGIRIIAPMPGKGTIGIEVPNANPVLVPMEPIVMSKKFVESKYELPIALGRTITNEIFMFDLAKMPHLLVAGATGQGKSVCLNAIITSLLYKKHPAEMKLVMVDPKLVEFSIYSPIENHYLAKIPDEGDAIITDVQKVIYTLKSLCVEMDSRYELLKDAKVRNITDYNKLFTDRKLNPQHGHRFMPYIVVIIDEFCDLIMQAGKEIELPIARIAQKARAVGIHMIIATQRPTTTIITGNIKANFPARIAFKVSQMIDSRTILDRPGAEQLIGRGDMLFLQGAEPIRIQCAFVDTPEVQNVCDFISSQQGYTSAYMLPEYVDENGAGAAMDNMDDSELDSLFVQAAQLVVSSQQGSTSNIQRKFSIGYNRAGRIMDQLEKTGIVGSASGSKPREVLCADLIELEQRLDNILK